ncbi:MAG: acyl-CoA thioesterase [Phenylobacterium sp.]|nr:acyl-CoA thioesterase [Phenylobacterium sp.]
MAAMPMNLRETLTLERLEVNLFRGRSPDPTTGRIFGGQVIAQALVAAYATVDGRLCHSLHCYFIRPGDPKIPIVFEVDRARDGQSFTTRRVIAVQNGRQIFNMACSFHAPEEGFEHQFPMPDSPGPEGFPDIAEVEAEIMTDLPEDQRPPMRQRPLEMRFVDARAHEAPEAKLPPYQRAWFRIRNSMGGDHRLHQAALAYCSDMALLSACARPHGVHWHMPGYQSASLDHAMWFHRPTDSGDWHLYEMDSPSASGARGFNRGAIYRQDGTLVASCAQEGLVRYRPPAENAAG